MHIVIIFVAVAIVLWVAVTPVFEYFRKKKMLERNEEIRRKDRVESEGKARKKAAEKAYKQLNVFQETVDAAFEAQAIAHKVQYPWRGLKVSTSFDTDTNKDLIKLRGELSKEDHKREFKNKDGDTVVEKFEEV